MCRLEVHFPEFPLLWTLLRVGHGKPSEVSGVGCAAGSAMQQCSLHRLSLICGLSACCGACDCPISPAAPPASSTSRPGLCVLLQETAPASPQGHSHHPSWTLLPVLVASSWDDHLLLACLEVPIFKSESRHFGNPSVPGKQDIVGHPVPARAYVFQMVLTLPHCPPGSLPNCLLCGTQGPRQMQRNSLTETASSAPCCYGQTR